MLCLLPLFFRSGTARALLGHCSGTYNEGVHRGESARTPTNTPPHTEEETVVRSPPENATQSQIPAARRCPAPVSSPPSSAPAPGSARGEGGNSNSAALHRNAASGAALQNSGTSERGRPRRPTACSARDGAQPAKTWKFWRCSVTERKPTDRHNMAAAEEEGPESSAAARTAPRYHWANSGCHPP